MEESFAIRRISLQAGVLTPAVPPYPCSSVMVVNGSVLSELRVYSRNDVLAPQSYIGITAGFTHQFKAQKVAMLPDRPACWVACDTPEVAVLIWVR